MMLADDSPIREIKLGDIIWMYDLISGMKVPLTVVKVHSDGGWDGALTWTWAIA